MKEDIESTKNNMDLLKNLKGSAQKAVTSISQAAIGVGKTMSETTSKTSMAVTQIATTAGKTVTETVSSAVDAVTSFTHSAYDNLCELAAKKIKNMLRGLDLQSTIEELNKLQTEKGTDVSALVNFIVQLKKFSEDDR